MDPSEEPAEQPTPEMTGENWIADGVPPARDARFTWYHELPAEALAREIFSRKNRGAALVTLKRPELHRGYFNGTVLISEEEFADARRELLDLPGVSVLDGDEHEITLPRMADGRLYPAVVVAVANATAVAEIKSLPAFESIEPLFVAQDGVGCSLPPYVPNPADGEISDNRIPWTYRHLGIVQAWDLGHSVDRPGYPVRIGVVDTGVFPSEQQLIEVFDWDSRRSHSHQTVVPKRWDDCGHGTRIAGLAAAPLDIQNIYPRKIVGIAYGANLTTVKYNSGVVATGGSRTALVSAINLAVGEGARIVNLALGMTYASTFVYDNIVAVYNTTQTIFVCAAGTFVPSVVFPASMPHVLAAAAVRSRDAADPQAGYELYSGPFPESASGPEVDFAAVNGDGDIPTTGGSAGAGGGVNVTSIGGSSSATAHMSGILALAWANQFDAPRSQVISRLRQSGSLRLIAGEENLTPGTSTRVGYGIPDAYLAAGGFRHASIYGPSTVLPGASYTLTAETDGWLPFNYLWDTGEHGRSVTVTAGASGTMNHSVTVTNPLDGTTIQVPHTVVISGTHRRILYSDPPIVHFPPYPFAGGTYDDKVNYGVSMPPGCAVLNVLGQRVVNVGGRYQNDGPPLRSLYLAWVHGFTVDRPGGVSPQSLTVDVRTWHGGVNAIRLKVHYVISEPDGVDGNVPGATVHGWYPA